MLPPSSAPSLASSAVDRFIASRRARWERLTALLDRANGRPGAPALSADELEELVRLYRQCSADLAGARRDFPQDRVATYLNHLVARAYGVIYRQPAAPLGQLLRFYREDLPRTYRAAWPYFAAAAALLFVPWLVLAVAIVLAPATARLVVPPGLLDGMQHGQTWFDSPVAERPLAASFIMTHNVEVALLALGGGMPAGAGTVAVLVQNGVQLGGITGALIAYGLGDRLIGFVGAHGFLELSVVVIAGGCGLMFGRAVLWPGLAPRGMALAAAGQRALPLLLGVLPFLALAGLLEGFVSPMPLAWLPKLVLGLALAAAMHGYLLRAGRETEKGTGRDGAAKRSKHGRIPGQPPARPEQTRVPIRIVALPAEDRRHHDSDRSDYHGRVAPKKRLE